MKIRMMTALCCALVGAAFTPQASADAWDRKTVITFSGPVEIPGVHAPGENILPAGTYVFKVLDSSASRHIVQIHNESETRVLATILAIPNYRLKATDKTVITFAERPAGEPEALRAWFYPGRNWGEEFVYPKAKAIELAKATNTPVLFVPDEFPASTQPIRSAAEPVVRDLQRSSVRAVQPSGEEVEIAQVVTPPPPAELAQADEPVRMAQSRPATLPDTAGPLALTALLGLLAMGGALAVRFARRRIA